MSNSVTDVQLYCASALTYCINSTTTPADLNNYWLPPIQFSLPFTQANIIYKSVLSACLVGQTFDGSIIIAFQGTVPTSIEDWGSDFFAVPFDAPGFDPNGTGAKVHTGFYLSFLWLVKDIEAVITPILQQNPNTPIYITGHSKGGGMAPIAAWFFSQVSSLAVPAANISVTTFAGPNPGNVEFANEFNALFSQNNYINHLDIVPFLPFDTTIGDNIEKAVNLMPNGIIKTGILDLLNMADNWNYYPSASTISYIDSSGNTNSYSTSDFLSEFGAGTFDLIEIGGCIVTLQISKILDAHSHLCGAGYATAVLSGTNICPSGNPSAC